MVDISWLTLAIFGLRRPWPAQPYLGPDPVSGSCAQVVVALPAVVEEVAVAAATSSSSSRSGSSSWCWPATASGSPHPHLASTCQSRAASPLLSPIQPHIHPGKLDLSLIFNGYSSWKTQFVFNIQTKLPSSGQFWYSPYWFWKTRFVFVFIFILENSIRLWCSICVTTNTDYYAQTSISPKLTKTRSSWLRCALRGDEAVYWVSLRKQWLVFGGTDTILQL